MRVAHFADAHLGHRRGHAMTKAGINTREADVASAFRRTVDGIIERKPDLVLFAGDLFDHVRPSNVAITFAVEQFGRLTQALPGVPVCLIAGNHDSPRTAEAGDILRLLEVVGVKVAVYRPRIVELDGATVTLIPHAAMGDPGLILEPTGRLGKQILVIHGDAVEGRGAGYSHEEAGGAAVPETMGFDLTCFGHYHVAHQVAEGQYYAGSGEYVSSNPWSELVEEGDRGLPGKGFYLHDLDTGAADFIHVPTRRHVNLPTLNCSDWDAPALLDQISRAVAAAGGVENAVARIVVKDVPRAVLGQLDRAALRELQRPALDFKIDFRKAEEVRVRIDRHVDGRRKTLPETLREYFGGYELPAGMDREQFQQLGQEILAQVENGAAPVRESAA